MFLSLVYDLDFCYGQILAQCFLRCCRDFRRPRSRGSAFAPAPSCTGDAAPGSPEGSLPSDELLVATPLVSPCRPAQPSLPVFFLILDTRSSCDLCGVS